MPLSVRARLSAGLAARVLAVAAPVAATAATAQAGNPGQQYNPATGLGVPNLSKFARDLASA
jgi:hypothetical protein